MTHSAPDPAPGTPPDPPSAGTHEAPRTDLAYRALLCSILALLPLILRLFSVERGGLATLVLGPLGAILGIIVLARKPASRQSKGMAAGAIVIGLISVGLIGLRFEPAPIPEGSPATDPSQMTDEQAALAAEQRALVACADNLRKIAIALRLYALQFDAQFPPDLQTLTSTSDIRPEDLVSPLSGNAPPACDYYYVSGLRTTDPGDWVIAYGRPAYTPSQAANVLMLDWTVQPMRDPEFTQTLQRFKAAYEDTYGESPNVVLPN
jgi:hypothetical protein